METMMMQMVNKECPQTCDNRTCNSAIHQKPKKRKKRRRHHKKKGSKCPAEGVASIVCVTKCMKKCRKTTKTDPCSTRTKSKCVRISCCSSTASDCSNSESKYCSKCGQSLVAGSTPGNTKESEQNSPGAPRLNHDVHAKNTQVRDIPFPEQPCISCHTETICTFCHNPIMPSGQSRRTTVGCVPECNWFSPPYFLGNVRNNEPKDLFANKVDVGWNGMEKQNKHVMQVTSSESRTVNVNPDLKDSPPPDNMKSRNSPATVHIRKCGKNIVTVRCGVDSDFDLGTMTSAKAGRTHDKERIGDDNYESNGVLSQKAQCSQRVIHITENQRSDNEGNCITKVECADYSSITAGISPNSNREGAPDHSERMWNHGYGPRSDPISSAAIPKSNLNIGYGPCGDRTTPTSNQQPHMVRMKFIKPCDNFVESSYRDLTCVPRPPCCVSFIPGPPVFRYDPCQCEDDYQDQPWNTQPITQAPPPIKDQVREFQPEENRSFSESPSPSSRSPSNSSQVPQGRYGYDFFYGTVRPV